MRLDQRLVVDGLAGSRARAQALIRGGMVQVDGAVVSKPGRLVDEEAEVALLGDVCPWVSRGALKLVHAIERFELKVLGKIVLDVGASTGGFTEVCLDRGAKRVYAVDVGRDQLHPSLRGHPRVVEISGFNARELSSEQVPEPVDLIVADVSFISLTKALPPALALAKPGAWAALLVKPQFEVGPARIGKGGIVKDAKARDDAVASVAAMLKASCWRVMGQEVSPILGGDGNEERLLAARKESVDAG